MFNNTIYIQVYPNRFELRHIESAQSATVSAENPFTTERLLIGQFSQAQLVLNSGMKELNPRKWLIMPPKVIIHPMEMTDGGLSEVEERILKELGMGAGARKVVIWVGHALSDREVTSKVNND